MPNKRGFYFLLFMLFLKALNMTFKMFWCPVSVITSLNFHRHMVSIMNILHGDRAIGNKLFTHQSFEFPLRFKLLHELLSMYVQFPVRLI